MRVIWTFWSKPLQNGFGSPWISYKHCLLSWILSVEMAKKHYETTVIYTDDDGLNILVHGIGLHFDFVSTALNYLDYHDPAWWSLGKLVAYRYEVEPFIHLDNDVFLWRPLPLRLINSALFAQNQEYFTVGRSEYYMPQIIEDTLALAKGGWLPEEWRWYRSTYSNPFRAVNCGIFGGNDLEFIHNYAGNVVRIIEHEANRGVLSGLQSKQRHMVTLEQFVLMACLEYWRNVCMTSNSKKTEIEYLFDSEAHAHTDASEIGYTHLIATAKRNPIVARRLEERVKFEYPQLYKRCLAFLQDRKTTC